MKIFKNTVFILLIAVFFSACEGMLDGINDDPNDIESGEVSAELYLTGAQLANISAQAGHMNRIAGMYSGQLVGLSSLYSNIYGFNLATSELSNIWSHIYVGSIANLRNMRERAPDDNLLQGIAKVTEAHAIGTAASVFGDIPYFEIADPSNNDPVFDSQISVFNSVINLLDEAIADLQSVSPRPLSEDIIFNGNTVKWIEAANTLKARYYLQLKDYGAAFDAAENGISSDDGTMRFIPRGDANQTEGDKNLFWQILAGPRTGDIGTTNSYLMQLLDDQSGISRNNAKTNEEARLGYYTIDESGGRVNQGIAEQFEPQNLVSYAENQLILAETATRESGVAAGLPYLNELRSWLDTGEMVNDNFKDLTFTYDPYDIQDFQAGGIENQDSVDPARALLREIIEERYVSGFGMYMAFNDSRRLRASDSDIAVPFVLVDGPNPPFVERFPYSDDELNSNENAPAEDPGLFTKTEVNR